jgi:short-subunit dehydrogenase involved in D-alanine esterification of teichoic acids
MDTTTRTALIAGGTAGIGLELARQLRAAGSTVIIGGRRTELLRELAAEGLGTVELDVTDDASVARARDAVLAEHPELDMVVTMAGMGAPEDLRDPAHFDTTRATIDLNFLGTVRVIDAVTPHLIERGAGTIATVSSGIGFLPFPLMAAYAASKAAVHAYSEALRAQLDGTGVEVAELVPPAVATHMGSSNPHALEVDAYVEEALGLLAQTPTPREVLVRAVHMHRFAERDGSYDRLVAERSKALAMLPGRQG